LEKALGDETALLSSSGASLPKRRTFPNGMLLEPVIPWFLHDMLGDLVSNVEWKTQAAAGVVGFWGNVGG